MPIFKRLKEKRSKRVLLVTPTSPHDIGTTKWMSPNLGIERLAGYLNSNGHYAETYDTNLHKAVGGEPSLENKIKDTAWDVIGFSVYEETMPMDIENMMLASRIQPDALIIAGGHSAQFDYMTILDKSPARLVVLGEGEKPLLKLVNGEPLEEIPGIVLKNYNEPLTPEEFKHATESIDYERIPYEKYWNYYIDLFNKTGREISDELSQQIHTIRIYTRNYCPMGCKFCSSTNFLPKGCGKPVRIADVSGQDLLLLIKRIIKAHPRVETIYFTDDDFCSHRNKLIEFLQLLNTAKLPVTFISFARIDDLDEEVVSLMVAAGFRTLNIGIESFQPEILKEYNKKLDPAVIGKQIALLNSYGMHPAVTFILCSPESRIEWIEDTAKRVLEELDKGTIHPGVNATVQPQKGSRFWEEYVEMETQLLHIPGTEHTIKREHFIKCTDPEVREFQYRLLYRWTNHIDRVSREESGGHLNSQTQSAMKLKIILDVIKEIKSERGSPDQTKYTNMSLEEKNKLWLTLQKYSYGASL